MRLPWIARAGLFSALLGVGAALAHPDDPKVRDRQPRYEGRGYRASDGAAARASFPSRDVLLQSWVTLPELNAGATSGADCWGYVSGSGREYAAIGISTGVAFVEITDPTNPSVVAHISGPNSLWRDVEIFQGYAYAVSEGGNGIQVIDLNNIDSGVVTLVRTITTGGTTTATHTVILDPVSGYLYRCGGGSHGLRVYDLNADPSNPTFITQWDNKYVHEALAVTYSDGPYAGKQIIFACNGFNGGFTDTGLEILDVTDKQNIVTLSRITWPNPGYSHQVWLSEDRKYAFVNDELDEQSFGLPMTILVIDVEDLTTPTLATTFTNGTTAIGHNLYVKGDQLFAANYRSGLRVFDISDPLAPVETHYFDTWVEDDQASFNGLWGNWPYFPSGTIIGSDLEKGLFVWQLAPLEYSFPDGIPTSIDPRGDTLRVQISALNDNSVDPASVNVTYTIDGVETTAPMTALGGDLYEAAFPASTCGDGVSFSFSASSVSGTTVNNPSDGSVYAATSAVSLPATLDDAFESDLGWVGGVPGDTALAGVWVRADPTGTGGPSPEDDHTTSGSFAWVTGNSASSNQNAHDVDAGRTTLLSPVLDFSAANTPKISYWRWFHNESAQNPIRHTDVLKVEITNDGVNWIAVETVGPSGDEANGGWFFKQFDVADFVSPTATVQVRFIAEDAGPSSTVEALVDDFLAFDVECPSSCVGDLTGDGVIDLSDLGIVLSDYGCTSGCVGDLDGNDTTDLSDLGAILSVFNTLCP